MYNNDGDYGGGYDDGGWTQPPPANWWEGPPPQGYSGPWPPPLAPGASYGPNMGQIIYGQAGDTNLPQMEDLPGYTPPTETTESPFYHPEYWQPETPPPVTTGGGTPTYGGGGGGTPTYTSPGAPVGVPTSGFGAAPSQYTSDPNAPQYQPLPQYAPPEWTGGDFVNPSLQDLYDSPGYQARLSDLMKGQTRQHAARGTILNGGTFKALDRAGQDYATNEYQQVRGNALENYRQRYSQFQDKAGMDLGARTLNANENQNSFLNRTNTYLQGNNRSLSDFLTNMNAKRNSELDMWSRLNDLNQTGAGLAGGSR